MRKLIHSFELHSNEGACRKSGRLGLEQVNRCSRSSSEVTESKFDEEIPVPSFLDIISYQRNVFDKRIFSIVIDGKAQRCGCTKSDDLSLNKYWGYMINKNRSKSLEEL